MVIHMNAALYHICRSNDVKTATYLTRMSDDLPGISPEILAFDALIDAMILDIAIDMHWHLRCIQSQGIAATHRDFATNMTVGNRLPVTVSSNHASMPHGIAGNHRQDSTPSSKRSLETSETPIDGNETNDKRLPTGESQMLSRWYQLCYDVINVYTQEKSPVRHHHRLCLQYPSEDTIW